jgi:N-methylhydantoinase B
VADFDAVSLQVVWQELIAAADEMGFTLVRTSFSTIVKDNKDFATCVVDGEGNLLAQSTESVPSYIGMIPITVRHLMAAHPSADLRPGDVLATNDPWLAAGHLHDLMTAAPVFHRGRLVAWVVAISHMPDIGGALSAFATEVYGEGLCLPPLKLVDEGREVQQLFDLIAANVRYPSEVLGDLRAQLSALTVGGRKVIETLESHGLADISSFGSALFDRSERFMRSQIGKLIEPGIYSSELETDGFDRPLKIRATVTVTDGSVLIDFEGTDAQIDRPVNSVLNYTYAMSVYPFKCLLDPETPINEGSFRPFAVSAPEGTLVNPRRPAAVWSRHLIGHYLPFLIFDAIAPHTRGRVMAESGSPSWAGYFRGSLNGRTFNHTLFANGGTGARSDRDGVSTMSFPSNTSNIPVEILENTVPLRVIRRALIADSGGVGRYRGGLGQEIAVEMLEGVDGRLTIRHEHVRFPPRGLLGGGPGRRGRNLINGREVAPKGEYPLTAGDIVSFELPGGGGIGDPQLRDPASAEADRAAGYVTGTPESVGAAP